MPIIREPNQSYERAFGRLRLYLDDLDDIYRQASECGVTKIGVGQDGVAQTVEDLRDADRDQLRLIRISTSDPVILISISAGGSSGVALNGEDAARKVVDNVAKLVQVRRRNILPDWIVYGALVIVGLVAFYFNIVYTQYDWVVFTTFAVEAAVFLTGSLYSRISSRRPVVIPVRRREASLGGRERRTQILVAVIAAILGLVTGVAGTVISYLLTGK